MNYTWVEPFSGAGAVALRLVGGRDLTPPVAYMGGKRRYARAIADAMGVPPGRPDQVLLNDAGPWGWVWQLLLEPTSAAEVAGNLKLWTSEHPRELWSRLAAEPPFEDVHERAAQWLWLQARSASGVPIWWDGWRHVDARGRPASDRGEDCRWGGHRRRHEAWKQADHDTGRTQGATQTGGDVHWVSTRPQQAGGVRDAKHALDTRCCWRASDGRGVPRPAGQKAVGGWEQGSEKGRPAQPAGQRGTWRMGDNLSGSRAKPRTLTDSDGGWRFDARLCDAQESRAAGQCGQSAYQEGKSRGATGGMVNPATIAERIKAISQAFQRVGAEVLHGPAANVYPRPGFCYLDPPYVGATGYGWDAPRDEVLGVAMAWYEAGAVVAVSEAEPLALEGWHHVELTLSGGKSEWLTLSRKPARLPERQRLLFGERSSGREGCALSGSPLAGAGAEAP